MKIVFSKIFVAVFSTVFFFSITLKSNANASLQSELKIVESHFKSSDDINVNVTITNTAKHSIELLKWYLPQKRIDSDIFRVTRDGENVRYQGRLIRRLPPTSEDYLVLEPGEVYSTTVELSHAYEMGASGVYSVQLITNEVDSYKKSKHGNTNNSHVSSNTISFILDNVSYAPQEYSYEKTATDNLFSKSIHYEACSNSQRSAINSANNAAIGMASNSVSYFSGTIRARYTTWFGANVPSRRDTVRNNFFAIQNALSTQAITYNCSCNENYFAYVYPNQPYKIYLCNTFWQVPTTGASSKADTIIHEISHFNVVAGTGDLVYGQSRSRNLAGTRPDLAIRNADNYSFFAANSPALP